MEINNYNIYGNNTDHIKLPEICKLKQDLEYINTLDKNSFEYYYNWLKILSKDKEYFYECEIDNDNINYIKNIIYHINSVKDKYNFLIDLINNYNSNSSNNIFIDSKIEKNINNVINNIIENKEKIKPKFDLLFENNSNNSNSKDIIKILIKELKNKKYINSYIKYKKNYDYNILLINISNNLLNEYPELKDTEYIKQNFNNTFNNILKKYFNYNIIIDNIKINDEIDSDYLYEDDKEFQNNFVNFIKINDKIFRKIQPKDFNFIKTNDNIFMYCNEIIVNNIIKDLNIIKNNTNKLFNNLDKSFDIQANLNEDDFDKINNYNDYINVLTNYSQENINTKNGLKQNLDEYSLKIINKKIKIKDTIIDKIYNELNNLPLLETNLDDSNDFLISTILDYNNYKESKKPLLVSDTNIIKNIINDILDYISNSNNNSNNNSNSSLINILNNINNIEFNYYNPLDNFINPNIVSKNIKLNDNYNLFDSVIKQKELYNKIKNGFDKFDNIVLDDLCNILKLITSFDITLINDKLLNNIINILNIKLNDLFDFNIKLKDFNINICILNDIKNIIMFYMSLLESINFIISLSNIDLSINDLAYMIFNNLFDINDIKNIIYGMIDEIKDFILSLIILIELSDALYDFIVQKILEMLKCLDDLDIDNIIDNIMNNILNEIKSSINFNMDNCKNNLLYNLDLNIFSNLLDLPEIKC